jgi:glutathione S-transferase
MDAAVITRYETALRPEELRWSDWIENQKLKFRRALDQLEPQAEGIGETIDIGTVAVGCALGYLDFRYPDEDWRQRCPNLARWFEHFSARASMRATLPAELR